MRQGAFRQAWLSEDSLHVVQRYLAPSKHGLKLCSLLAKHENVNPASFPFCLDSIPPCLCCLLSTFPLNIMLYSMGFYLSTQNYRHHVNLIFYMHFHYHLYYRLVVELVKYCLRDEGLVSSVSHTFDPPRLLSLAGFDTRLELGLCWHPPLLSPLSCSQQIHHGLAAH